uniref:KIF-binding protein n=1 Tax=Neobodo designis TaxID=312471 RepID=A0A7S1QZ76_NEODS|mmetsp:Transcript_54887/g.169183  ORF Transcript_54887/g.169183 Transcript_54887/m.169183 type:complete len:555 (+) Transcript_54887:26-1690(+)|eukprot:CAMPEP_0174854484 /NCGR_PEP_ID=MMETSP1114-20130205/31298_1 /TAXON_ID=312471 /ORGANISM="Neobodo designis, Strain CCAP 1951/1" /LENGTH=554 /DNA_ID=CAMNT_0016089179 /DNA_START=25 /DNA_END=1689 /DNA_ORIENTATION=+
MEPTAFRQTFESIKQIDTKEGPSRNIFEPRFQAREQAVTLRDAVYNAFRENSSKSALMQLAKLLLFLGMNHFETEEVAEGELLLRRAFLAAKSCVTNELVDPTTVDPPTVREIVGAPDTDVSVADNESIEVWMEALNTIGVFLSNRSSDPTAVQDARRVLHAAEDVYLSVNGKPVQNRLESMMTSTVYFLAQAYGAAGDGVKSARYVHDTMVRQLQTEVEFSKQSWATNAVHLAAYYAGEQHFGYALHCLECAEVVMPSEPASEETVGVVAWGFGKFWKTILREGARRKEEGCEMASAAGVPWWKDLPVPGVSPPTRVAVAVDFESARTVFQKAVRALQTAGQYYTYENCCPDFIAIQQDIADCYKQLSYFEPDVERKAAMLQRRIDGLERFPSELSFQAYATLVRQLWYDLGESAVDLFDLRLSQRERREGHPLSVRQLNYLCRQAMAFFQKFLDTLRDKSGQMPTVVDSDLRVPVFRVMMRLARMNGKIISKSAESEYEVVRHTIELYDSVLVFVENNKVASVSEVETEVSLARQMKELLPGKLRDLRRAFH